MSSYEKNLKKNTKRNEKFIIEFEDWLNDKKLSSKTIRKHIENIDLYLNYYLSYYEVTEMEKGVNEAYSFLNDWYIRKCLFASITSLKETAASIKKFYQCMSEKKYIDVKDYKYLCREINENMDDFLYSLQEFENIDDEYYNILDEF